MSLSQIANPYGTILALDGRGLNNGDLYIGEFGQDPETDPQAVYWDADGTIPASQPLSIVGGYIMRLGTPAQAFTASSYSIRVKDHLGVQVFLAQVDGSSPLVFSSLTIGDNMLLPAAGFSGAALAIAQLIPGFRGELQLWPCDTGGVRDAFAGGEYTILADDPRVSGFANNLAAAFYFDRDGSGNTRSVRFRMIPNGTATPVPMRFDSTGGVNNFQLDTDGGAWGLGSLQLGGTIDDRTTPSSYASELILGPSAGPIIDLWDTNSGASKRLRFRNIDGILAIIDVVAGTILASLNAATKVLSLVGLKVSNTGVGAASTVDIEAVDTGPVDNNWRFGAGITDFGQFGLYDVTGSKLVYQYRRTTLGAAGGRHRFYDPIQLDNPYVAGATAPTGTLILYDSNGVAYKIPAQVA